MSLKMSSISCVDNMGSCANSWRHLLPQLVSLNLLSNPPHLAAPVHFIFGEQDPLISAEIVQQLPSAIASPKTTVMRVPDAGHMVHFDQPEVVRSIVGWILNSGTK